MEHSGMWQTRDEEERQKRLEKLIDWELSKQLTWAVVFLTTILGLLALFASGLLHQWIVFSRFYLVTVNLVKAPFVVIFFLLLVFGVDLSFYRLAASLARLRNWIEMLPSELQRRELIEKVVLGWFYGLFVERRGKNRFSLRAWLVWLLIVLVDLVLIWALVSVR
jgi:hypothetical protein